MKSHNVTDNFEGIVLEINLQKGKWLLFGGYNPHNENITHFLTHLSFIVGHYLTTYENYLLIGDFDSKIEDDRVSEMYNLTSLIREPTCIKNVLNPSSIDLTLTNRPKQFQQSCTVETGLSDHHKMTITVLKTSFQKQSPTIIKYRDYKRFDVVLFRSQLLDRLYETIKVPVCDH